MQTDDFRYIDVEFHPIHHLKPHENPMKSRINPFVRFSTLLTAATIALAASAQAADFTWDGGTGNWNATNWNSGAASGPTTAGNTATINSGIVNVNVGGTGSLDSITLGSGAQMNVYNGDGGIYAYTTFANLILQGGTLNGGSATYHTYGTSMIGNLTVSGSAASTITSGSWFNLVPSTTFTVADVTTGADLLVNSRMYAPPLDGNDNAWGTAALTKEGLGTMRLTLGTYNVNVTVNAGTLEFVGEAEAGAGGGYGFVRNGTITVNSGATLSLTGSSTGFGWRTDNPSSITINGGTVTSGTNHIFDIGGGVNMTGGLLDSTTGSFQWKGTALNTLASANTATIAGGLNLRTDYGAFTQTVNVADGAAATDLLISANITQASGNAGGITKTGAGTMTLSGNSTYTGATTVSVGTLLVTGALGNSAVSVASSATVGGSGTIGSTLSFAGDSFFDVFSAVVGNDPLAVTGTVSFGSGFGIDNLTGINWASVAPGTYTLIDSVQDFSLAGLDNWGIANAFTVDAGKSAYFQSGSLQLVVVPEPRAALLGGLGLLALLRRRRSL